MAFDKTPTTWLANWSEDGTDITVPLATFPEMSAADADASTGDIRHIVFAICEKLHTTYVGTATGDRPNKMTISKTATVHTARNVIASRYTFSIETEIATQEVRVEVSNTPSHTVSHTPSHTASRTPSSTASHTASRTPSST